MKGTAKRKVVTSGRLTGGVKGQQTWRRVTPNPVGVLQPNYSLYSTDSEDQVTNLHIGLDRCAALLGGILQAEKDDCADSKPNVTRATKAGGAKPKSAATVGKKMAKRPPAGPPPNTRGTQHARSYPGLKPLHQSSPSKRNSPAPPGVGCDARAGTPTMKPQSATEAATRSEPASPRVDAAAAALPSQPKPPLLLSMSQSHSHRRASPLPPSPLPHKDSEEDECVPVRDESTQSRTPKQNGAVPATLSQVQPECVRARTVPQGGLQEAQRDLGNNGTEVKVLTAQQLVGELKAVIAGQGNVAERLLCDLEQTVSLSSSSSGTPSIQAESEAIISSLLSQNTQLRRRVRILNQQLKEWERQHNMYTHSSSEAMLLQAEVTAAQSHLQKVRSDASELRQSLQDTQKQLRETETENTVIRTDLKVIQGKLLDKERENADLALLAQQRLEEVHRLNRILRCPPSAEVTGAVSDPPLTRQHFEWHQQGQEASTNRVNQYLLSLEQLPPTEHPAAFIHRSEPEGKGGISAEREAIESQNTAVTPSKPKLAPVATRRLSFSRDGDIEVMSCDWNIGSESTFNTKDEAAFRDGLAALDASIESLQRTLKMDLAR